MVPSSPLYIRSVRVVVLVVAGPGGEGGNTHACTRRFFDMEMMIYESNLLSIENIIYGGNEVKRGIHTCVSQKALKSAL